MRPGQNKRMRGRNNNNNGHRRGPNPLTRSYESNGPDVKIRGTAQHIGEKYLQLARDAQTSGDPVAAENYLQHAEHYFRIIAAAQQAQQQAQAGYQRQPGEADAEDVEGEDDVVMPDRFALPSERFGQQPAAQQPNGGGQPNGYGQQSSGYGQQPYPDRQNNGGDRNQDRQDQPAGDQPFRADQQRPYGDGRQDRDQRYDRGQRQDREPRQDRDGRQDRDNRPYNNEQRAYGDRGGYERNGERPPYEQQRERGYRNDRNDRNGRGPRYPRDGQDYPQQRNGGEPGSYADNRETQAREPARPDPVTEVQPDVGADLPAFITAPARPTPPAPEPEMSAPTSFAAETPASEATGNDPAAAEGESFAVRPRRRRRTRAMIEADNAAATAAGATDQDPASD